MIVDCLYDSITNESWCERHGKYDLQMNRGWSEVGWKFLLGTYLDGSFAELHCLGSGVQFELLGSWFFPNSFEYGMLRGKRKMRTIQAEDQNRLIHNTYNI